MRENIPAESQRGNFQATHGDAVRGGRQREETRLLTWKKAAMVMMAISLVIAHCTHGEDRRYRCADDGFSILIPDSWKVHEHSRGTRIIAELPDSGSDIIIHQNLNVVVDASMDSVDLDTYVESQILSMRKLRGIEFSNREKAIIGGIPARYFTYHYVINDFGYRAVVYVVKSREVFIVITGISQDENYSSLAPVFHRIAKSVEFI